MSSFDRPKFTAKLRLFRGRAQVDAAGEVDVATRDILSEVGIDALERPAIDEVVVDLGAVTFLDAAGVGSLVRIRNRSSALGKKLVLSRVPARIARLLRLTGLQRQFSVTSGESAEHESAG